METQWTSSWITRELSHRDVTMRRLFRLVWTDPDVSQQPHGNLSTGSPPVSAWKCSFSLPPAGSCKRTSPIDSPSLTNGNWMNISGRHQRISYREVPTWPPFRTLGTDPTSSAAGKRLTLCRWACLYIKRCWWGVGVLAVLSGLKV